MSKNNVLNNEEIIIIQNEIDNLENLLFSKDKDSSQNESNFNMNNFTKVYEPEKINNNSFKNDSLSKNENNITYQIQDQILFGNSNNSIENNLNDAKKDNIKNNNTINLNDANINCNYLLLAIKSKIIDYYVSIYSKISLKCLKFFLRYIF